MSAVDSRKMEPAGRETLTDVRTNRPVERGAGGPAEHPDEGASAVLVLRILSAAGAPERQSLLSAGAELERGRPDRKMRGLPPGSGEAGGAAGRAGAAGGAAGVGVVIDKEA